MVRSFEGWILWVWYEVTHRPPPFAEAWWDYKRPSSLFQKGGSKSALVWPFLWVLVNLAAHILVNVYCGGLTAPSKRQFFHMLHFFHWNTHKHALSLPFPANMPSTLLLSYGDQGGFLEDSSCKEEFLVPDWQNPAIGKKPILWWAPPQNPEAQGQGGIHANYNKQRGFPQLSLAARSSVWQWLPWKLFFTS